MNDLLVKNAQSPMEKAQKIVELTQVIKEAKSIVDEYKVDLLKATQEMDVLTLKTGSYTITRAKRITPRVVSFKQLKESLDKENIPYETEEAFTAQMDLVFKQLVKDKKELNGLEALETEYIMVRTPEKAEKE